MPGPRAPYQNLYLGKPKINAHEHIELMDAMNAIGGIRREAKTTGRHSRRGRDGDRPLARPNLVTPVPARQAAANASIRRGVLPG